MLIHALRGDHLGHRTLAEGSKRLPDVADPPVGVPTRPARPSAARSSPAPGSTRSASRPKRSGLSKGALYYYFSDKDDLYETVLERFCDAILERWSGGTKERIPAFSRCETREGYWREWVAHFRRSMLHDRENPVEAELFRRSLRARASGTSHPALSAAASRIREWIREALRRGQQIGADCARQEKICEMLSVRLILIQ